MTNTVLTLGGLAFLGVTWYLTRLPRSLRAQVPVPEPAIRTYRPGGHASAPALETASLTAGQEAAWAAITGLLGDIGHD